MSQWGLERTINGARFIPDVSTPMWEPIQAESRIADILLLDTGGDREQALRELDLLLKRYAGQPYQTWVNEARG